MGNKILVTYYSRTGNTQKMAEKVAEGARTVKGVAVDLHPVAELTPDDLLGFNGIIMGSPVYYGTMASELKQLIDKSVCHHGKLVGKVGGAFASSANPGGGNETTVLDIVKALLIHGMIIAGDPDGDHYGPTAVGAPDARSSEECRRLGKRVAELVVKLLG